MDRPLAVYVHGGGFTSGEKNRGKAIPLVDTPADVIPILGVRGISSPVWTSLRSAALMRYGVLRLVVPPPLLL